MLERDQGILEQMLEYCERIERRIEKYEINESSFVGDPALQDMLLMPIFQIGELSHGLSDEFANTHRQIPWHAIRAFRNIIAHDYGAVDPLWVWNTVTCDIPILHTFLSEALR